MTIEKFINLKNDRKYYNKNKDRIVKLPAWYCSGSEDEDPERIIGFASPEDPETYFTEDVLGFIDVPKEIALDVLNTGWCLNEKYTLFNGKDWDSLEGDY